jgi:hypothetical protein
MKWFFSVLLMLVFVVPASADLYVYNYKEVDTGFSSYSDWEPNSCEQIKEYYTAFLIVDLQDNTIANVWAIWTSRYKGAKYASTGLVAEGMDAIAAQISTKKVVQIFSYDDGTSRIFLTGQIKPKKIGYGIYNVASSMTGYWVWNNDDNLGVAKITMSLNVKLSAIVKLNSYTTAQEGAESLLDYLEFEQGYNP